MPDEFAWQGSIAANAKHPATLKAENLLAEATWGRGLGSELVDGLISWCRDQTPVVCLTAGVAPDNVPSRRLLERLGFELADHGGADTEGDVLYQLRLPG